VRVPGYRYRGHVFDSWHYQIFCCSGSGTGPLSLVNTIEELLRRRSSGSDLENRVYGFRDPLCCPRNTVYPQKFAYKRRFVCFVLMNDTKIWQQSLLIHLLHSALGRGAINITTKQSGLEPGVRVPPGGKRKHLTEPLEPWTNSDPHTHEDMSPNRGDGMPETSPIISLTVQNHINNK
jgi:hypothetical protein